MTCSHPLLLSFMYMYLRSTTTGVFPDPGNGRYYVEFLPKEDDDIDYATWFPTVGLRRSSGGLFMFVGLRALHLVCTQTCLSSADV